jgi:hypothetical protein
MDKAELIAAIDGLRDDLAEARRYVRTRPDETNKILTRFRYELNKIRWWDTWLHEFTSRCFRNLDGGEAWMMVAPTVLENYIECASFELAWIKGQVEKGDLAQTT